MWGFFYSTVLSILSIRYFVCKINDVTFVLQFATGLYGVHRGRPLQAGVRR